MAGCCTGTFEPRGSSFSQASLIPHATSATTTRTATIGRALCHGGRAVEEREGSMREVVFMRAPGFVVPANRRQTHPPVPTQHAFSPDIQRILPRESRVPSGL